MNDHSQPDGHCPDPYDVIDMDRIPQHMHVDFRERYRPCKMWGLFKIDGTLLYRRFVLKPGILPTLPAAVPEGILDNYKETDDES